MNSAKREGEGARGEFAERSKVELLENKLIFCNFTLLLYITPPSSSIQMTNFWDLWFMLICLKFSVYLSIKTNFFLLYTTTFTKHTPKHLLYTQFYLNNHFFIIMFTFTCYCILYHLSSPLIIMFSLIYKLFSILTMVGPLWSWSTLTWPPHRRTYAFFFCYCHCFFFFYYYHHYFFLPASFSSSSSPLWWFTWICL